MKEREQGHQQRELTQDYVHKFRGCWTDGGVCHIRIYEGADEPLVIATEIPENENASITNMAEYLAYEVMVTHFPDRFEEEKPLTWIEQYPRLDDEELPEYSVVEFEDFTPRIVYLGGEKRVRIGQPQWRHLSEEEFERLIAEE